MKRARVLLVLALLFLPSLMPVVMATPTLSQTDSESPAAFTIEDNSKDSDIFVEDWLYSLLDNVFGLDRRDNTRRYYSGGGGWDTDHGAGGSHVDPGDGGLGYNQGSGDWAHDHWGSDHGNGSIGNDDTDISPVQSTPSPGALVLSAIGLSFVSWLRRSRTL